CPFGAIYTENGPYLINYCDFCFDRMGYVGVTRCIESCSYGDLSLKEANIELDENTFLVVDILLVHSTQW
ncbi:MAG: hypothetical protein ABIK26_05775, partial [Candidatus Omnitrophota bacterium]